MARFSSGITLDNLFIFWTSYAVKPTNIIIEIIDNIKSKVVLFINMFIIEQIIMAINHIIKYVTILVKSTLVTDPMNANIPNIKAVIKNTYITDVIWYARNIPQNVSPLIIEYIRKVIFAVVGLILVILADKNITSIISKIASIIYPYPPKIFIAVYGWSAT